MFYRHVFHNVSFWEKVPSASHDDVIARLATTLWGLDLNDEASLLLCRGSYGQTNCVK